MTNSRSVDPGVEGPQELVRRVRRSRAEAAALQLRAALAIDSTVSTLSSIAARHGHRLRSHAADPAVHLAAVSSWPAPVAHVFTVAAVGAVRNLVRKVASRAGLLEAVVPDFVLAVQELMTNAIRHGGGWGRVRLHRDGQLLVCVVTDRGPGMTGDSERFGELPEQQLSGGRGIFLARRLTDDLRISTTTKGVTVTITMNLSASASPPTTGDTSSAPG